MKADKGICIPKNKMLHKAFNARFMPNKIAIAGFCSFFELVHAKYKDKEIKMKRVVHAIGNTKPGGVIDGFTELYQAVSVLVARLPTSAAK